MAGDIRKKSGLEGFQRISSFIVVSEQLIVCVQYVDLMFK